jgi:BMFP domain-containing protein YqiC
MSVIKALATLLHAANDFAPEDDPDKYDVWRMMVCSARHEYDALRKRVAALEAERDEARTHVRRLSTLISTQKEMDAKHAELADRAEAAESRSAALEDALRGLADWSEAFAVAVDSAIAAAEAPKTGMLVPFHGDFANAAPSVRNRLRWWAREFREREATARAALASGTTGEGAR